MKTNETPRYDASVNTTGCCPKFNPAGWDATSLHRLQQGEAVPRRHAARNPYQRVWPAFQADIATLRANFPSLARKGRRTPVPRFAALATHETCRTQPQETMRPAWHPSKPLPWNIRRF
ncbi:MAG: hypothetical protein E5X73_02440 [Mesorhizobium sp.]|nr:MAG: hypothetical protein E5X73_03485 [Mesorhizobium sp.]TIP14860.1 MAG: hypothetical protein E5X73_02440 [Mesorhizobium sp.]